MRMPAIAVYRDSDQRNVRQSGTIDVRHMHRAASPTIISPRMHKYAKTRQRVREMGREGAAEGR